MKKKLVDIESLLICPDCLHKIIRKDDCFYCKNCDSLYSIINDVPLLIKSLNNHKKREIDYHSSVSKIYRELHQLGSYRNIYYHLQSLKPIFELGRNAKVLELGCGTGYDGTFLSRKGLTVVETDISLGQVLEAKNKLIKKGLSKYTFFYVADAEKIPFTDESFDATFIMAALHHLEDPVKSLSEMKRCTKKGGTIVIAMEPNRYEWLRLIGYTFSLFKKITLALFGKKPFKTVLERTEELSEPNIGRSFSKKEILSLMEKAELNPKKITGIWFTCGFIHWFITLLNKITKRTWYISKDAERIFVLIDELLARIPFINSFACNWTVHCRKD